MEASADSFLRTGVLGAIKAGAPEQLVQAELGEPEGVAYAGKGARTRRAILKYGALQLGVRADLVERIELRPYQRVDPWPYAAVHLEGWSPALHPARAEVELHVAQLGLTWYVDPALTGKHKTGVRLSSGVVCVYDETSSLEVLSYSLDPIPSYDLAIWESSVPVSDAEAASLYGALNRLDAPSVSSAGPTGALLAELLARYPDLTQVDERAAEESPWARPVHRAGVHVVLHVRRSHSDVIRRVARALAGRHGLIVYDPQKGRAYAPRR